MKSFYILNEGCPKNEVDAQAMAALLRCAGLEEAKEAREADFVIVNTCGFIAPAREESLRALRLLARRKRRGQRLIAAGCLAQLAPELILRAVPHVDALLGTRRWHEVAELLGALGRDGQKPVWVGDSPAAEPQVCRTPPGVTAYVKIAEGCDAPCAFCTIPRIKGQFRSRTPGQVVAEAAELARRGYKELILIAQDTTAYGRDWGEKEGLASLIEAILAATPELVWLRVMYTYPQHITERLIEVMARHPQVCHYLDMPLQHAHPDILRRMRRPADVAAIYRLVERLRTAMPDIALRTTFIVGYPGEEERHFEALLDFVEAVRFDRVGAFIFSPEEGTAAARLEPQVSLEVAQDRLRRLMARQEAISLARNEELLGKRMTVLVEGAGEGLTVGRTYRDAPEIDGLALIRGELPAGTFVEAVVVQALVHDLVMQPV